MGAFPNEALAHIRVIRGSNSDVPRCDVPENEPLAKSPGAARRRGCSSNTGTLRHRFGAGVCPLCWEPVFEQKLKWEGENHCFVPVSGGCYVSANMCVTGTHTANGNWGSRRNKKLEKSRNLIGALAFNFLQQRSQTFFFKIFYLFIYLFIYLFLKRGEEREININVWLPLKRPLRGAWLATQACALTGNQTCSPLRFMGRNSIH